MSFAFGGGAVHPLLEFAKTYNLSLGFEAHTHFISIVRAIEHQTVHAGANQAAKNGCRLSDLTRRNVVVQWRNVVHPWR